MKLLHILLIIGVGLLLSMPALLNGFPELTDDAAIHVSWFASFSEQLWSGDLYPRWLAGMNGSLGSPAFFFYPPSAYYATSLFRFLFTNDPFGWQQLGASASLALILSGLCAYLWLSQIATRRSAMAAAILYMMAPYHLAIDLYIRGAFAEFWAFVWMPLILYFVLIARHDKIAVAGLAVSYGLLVTTHLPTTLIFSALPICYAFFTTEPRQRMRVVGLTLCGMTLGTGLAAIYLLPAMTTQEFVLIKQMKTGFFYYENWFLFAKLRLSGDRTARLSQVVLATAVPACCAFILSRSSADRQVKRESLFWMVVSVLSVFMTTPLSKPIWYILPTLQAIQLPSRFSALLSVSTVALLALGISSVKRPYSPLIRGASVVALLCIISWVLLTAVLARRAYFVTNPAAEEVIEKTNKLIQQRTEAFEYLPVWAKTLRAESVEVMLERKVELLAALLQKVGTSEEGLSRVKIAEGAGSVRVSEWKPGNIVLDVDTPSGALLTVSQFYYPNWTADVIQPINEPSPLTLRPSEPDGLLSVAVPSGRHQVMLRLNQSPVESAGLVISLVAAAITLLLVGWSRAAERVSQKVR